MNCKNCGDIATGKFCSNCGQSTKVDRINLPNFLNEVSESLLQINKGFFYTLKELFVRPGESLNEFLEGKRKNHFKPIAYVLTLSTLYFLITQITHQNTWMDDLVSGWVSGITNDDTGKKVPGMLTWFSKNYAYSALILLPVFSLASYWSFSKYGKNYLEHMIINSYVTGQQAIFYALFALAKTVSASEFLEFIPVFIAISYMCWVFGQLFSEGNFWTNILRSILTYTLYFIFSIGLLFTAMIIDGMG